MTKNKMFKRRYTITFKGITTNNHMQKFLDSVFDSFVDALGRQFVSLKVVSYKIEDLTKGKGEQKNDSPK